MKKLLALLLMAIMVVSMVPLALADTEESGDDDTVADVSAMASVHGAEVRLLQLEQSIDRAINHSNEVLARIDVDANVSAELEAIVAEMVVLKADVQAADPAADDAVDVFVALRHDASDLVKQFRDLVHDSLSDEDLEALRVELQAQFEADREAHKAEIEAKRCEHNSEQVARILASLNVTDDQLVADVAACAVDWEETRDYLRETYGELSDEQKMAVRAELQGDIIQHRIRIAAKVDAAQDRANARFDERMQQRIEKIDNDTLRIRLEDRFEHRVEIRDDRIEEHREERDARIEGQAQVPGVRARVAVDVEDDS